MALSYGPGRVTGEDVADLQHWLTTLTGCPPVTATVRATCHSPTHAEPAGWFYVEADPAGAVARRRCLACGTPTSTWDSDLRWTHPRMWSCPQCGQSIAEVAAGLHEEADGRVTWVAMACRCVGCGTLTGLTDLHVEGNREEVVARL